MKSGSTSNPPSRRIQVLREDVARKIAAGEVIDRPYSVIRELLDNALDASSHRIEVAWENGGIDLIRVTDNGTGIHPDDLPLAVQTHATSKIISEHDLEELRSLGFRGEALASIAAVSRLEIHSSMENGTGSRLNLSFGGQPQITSHARSRGTTVTVQDIFLNIPARRKFLRSARSESLACRRAFEEKVIAFPEVDFSLVVDSQHEVTYAPTTHLQRIKAMTDPALAAELQITEGAIDWAQLEAIYAPPRFSRRDRTGIQVFINRRRITDFGLIQAIQFAFGDFQSGGSFPYCFLFLDIEPQEVDFNIHPAKREVRIRQNATLHQFVTRHLRAEFKPLYQVMPNLDLSPNQTQGETLISYPTSPTQVQLPSWARELPPNREPSLPQTRPWRYLGQIFMLYLLVEKEGKLLVIDQHAAHERINFDRLRARKGERQQLLVPLQVTLDNQLAEFWSAHLDLLEELGLQAEFEANSLIIRGIPSLAQGFESEIIDYLMDPQGTDRDLERGFYARMACRMSIMANEELDDEAAQQLLKQVFELPEPRCPHGRPIWVEVTEEALSHLFGRTH